MSKDKLTDKQKAFKLIKSILLPLLTIYAMTTCLLYDGWYYKAIGVFLTVVMIAGEDFDKRLITALKDKIKRLEDKQNEH